jgi:hypothetical protein
VVATPGSRTGAEAVVDAGIGGRDRPVMVGWLKSW